MKNLLTATINHNNEDRRIKLVLHKTEYGYKWYEAETGLETGCPVADTIDDAKEYAQCSWGAKEWDLQASWL